MPWPIAFVAMFGVLASEPNPGLADGRQAVQPARHGDRSLRDGQEGVVNIDFNFEESPTFDRRGVLGNANDTFWNAEYPPYGEKVWLRNLIEADGVTESPVRIAFRIDLRGRQAPGHPLLRDYAAGRTDFTAPSLPDPGPSDLVIEGLTPDASYDVCFYSAIEAGFAATIGGQTLETSGTNRDELVAGDNYVVFRHVTADAIGRIGGVLDDSQIDNANGQFVLGGIQIAPTAGTLSACAADLAEPFGQVDIFDATAFLSAFDGEQPAADLAEPTGQWDIADVVEFLKLAHAGCP